MLVLIQWSKLADRYGRKRIMLISLCGMSISPILFGFSKNLWQMVLFRCLGGVFSGSGLIIRTMISEFSTPETQARAFSWFAFGSNFGIFLGPLIGGMFADPANQYPGTFGGIRFFEKYPFALSGIATGVVSVTSVITTALFLRDPREEKLTEGNTPNGDQPAAKPMSTWQLLKAPSVAFVLFVYNHAALLGFTFTAVVPVYLFTPVELGGINFSAFQNSIFISIQGIAQAIWLLVFFPMLQHRLGTRGVNKLCGYFYPFDMLAYIVLNLLMRNGGKVAGGWWWVVMVFACVVGPGVSMAFTGVQLALNDVSPDQETLGMLNAVALTISSGIRAVAPGCATVIYALGVKYQILMGQLAWVILTFVALAFTIAVHWLPKGDKPKQAAQQDEEETI
jgi:MFS family permease